MRRRSMNNNSSCHRWRWLTFLAAIAISLAVATDAQAKLSFISGVVFLEEDLPAPEGVGNEAIANILGPGRSLALADDELGESDVSLLIDLIGYVNPTDTVVVRPLLLFFDDPKDEDGFLIAEFLFESNPDTLVGSGVLELLPSPEGLFGSGSITAEIIGIGENTTGVDLSGFVGGQFQLTYNGTEITAGTAPGESPGDPPIGGTVRFGPVSTASFSIAVEIPEPASFLLAAIGMVGLLSMRRTTRTRRRQQPST